MSRAWSVHGPAPYAPEFSHTDKEAFNCFLQHTNADVKLERKRNLLIMNNASWHQANSLTWGDSEPIYLPAINATVP